MTADDAAGRPAIQRQADVIVTTAAGQVRLGPVSEAVAGFYAELLREAARWDAAATAAVITIADHGKGCMHPDFPASVPRTPHDLAELIARDPGAAAGGAWPGLYAQLIVVVGHREAARLWRTAGLAGQDRPGELQRLSLIAALITPCPAPDTAGGYDLGGCGHGGTWPCGTTRAAWLARGLDPDQEVRRIVQAVRQAAGPDLDEIADDEDVLC